MPTAVERGIGVKAIIAVLKNEERGTPIEDTIRELAGDPPSELVGKGFGQDIGLLNFALPTDKHLGGLLLPAVQEMLPAVQEMLPAVQHVDLLGVGHFDDGLF